MDDENNPQIFVSFRLAARHGTVTRYLSIQVYLHAIKDADTEAANALQSMLISNHKKSDEASDAEMKKAKKRKKRDSPKTANPSKYFS